MPNILFFGDNHSHFRHIVAAVEREKPDAIVLLGDIQAQMPLGIELAPILGRTTVRFIHGNHDTDRPLDFCNLFESDLAGSNLHGRVEEIAGVRIAGLGGIFRNKVWMPPAKPHFDTYQQWLTAHRRTASRRDDAGARLASQDLQREHRSTIFPSDVRKLKTLRADVLVTHEAPSAHPHGIAAIDELAQAMGVQVAFHGHHHDRLDYREKWPQLRFKAYGVGFCGITNLDGVVVRPGDFDESKRQRNN
jgi:predicted phosphodiesterase